MVRWVRFIMLEPYDHIRVRSCQQVDILCCVLVRLNYGGGVGVSMKGLGAGQTSYKDTCILSSSRPLT